MTDKIVVGAEDILRKFENLERKIGSKIARNALRQSCRVFQSAIKERAPKDTGFMASKIKVRAGKRKKGRISMEVSLGAGFFKDDSFYGSFQEFGWKQGKRSLGDDRKQVEGKHFFEEGFKAKGPQQAAEIPRMLWQGIKDELGRGGKAA